MEIIPQKPTEFQLDLLKVTVEDRFPCINEYSAWTETRGYLDSQSVEVRTLPSFSYVSVGSKFAQVNCLPIRVISHKSKLSITSMKRKAIERCIDHCCFLHYFLKMLKSTPPPKKKGVGGWFCWHVLLQEIGFKSNLDCTINNHQNPFKVILPIVKMKINKKKSPLIIKDRSKTKALIPISIPLDLSLGGRQC